MIDTHMKQPASLDDLGRFEAIYPELFAAFRSAGWSPARRVDSALVEAEPHWPTPFPMHALAREFLHQFHDLHCAAGHGREVRFGCGRSCTASSLKDSMPYDAERLVLGEPVSSARPPAFPIGTMNDWMLFMREDWSTITIGFNWNDILLTDDPFAVIDEFRTDSRRIWDDPRRHIAVTDFLKVPDGLVGLWDPP